MIKILIKAGVFGAVILAIAITLSGCKSPASQPQEIKETDVESSIVSSEVTETSLNQVKENNQGTSPGVMEVKYASGESLGNTAKGGFMPEGTMEEISDWGGVIKSIVPEAQYDDYFERQDTGQVITFGIDSLDLAIKAQIESLRDTGKIVHVYGKLFSNVPDYNHSQIQVERIVVEE